MKRAHLKHLVEFIVRRTFAEMSARPEMQVFGEDSVEFDNVQTDDGRLVGGAFALDGMRDNSGVGHTEFQGHRAYDAGQTYWVLESWRLLQAWVSGTHEEINIQDPANKAVVDALNAEIKGQQEAIETHVNQNK